MSTGGGAKRRRRKVLPPLPADAWGLIAQATLAAEGDDVQSWATLRLVSRAWRDGLQGAPVSFLRCRSNTTRPHAAGALQSDMGLDVSPSASCLFATAYGHIRRQHTMSAHLIE